MKLKGINPLEQHVEKIVVVAVGAVLLGVIAQQFLTQPNEIKVGNETLSPGRAYEPVKKAAQVLKGQLDSTNPPLEPGFEASGKDMHKEFTRLTSAGISPRPRIAPLGPSVVLGGSQIKASDAPFAEITLPTPTPAVAASFWATISSDEVAEHPELAALLPEAQPFDRAFVSVESSFDVKALIESLLADPDSGGPIESMPQGWWRDGIEAVVVEAEREKLNSDGAWASPTTLPGMLGRPLFVMAWNESVKTTSDMQLQVVEARRQSAQVLRPTFYRTLGGQEWSAPSILAARAAANIDPNVIEAKKAELAKVQTDLAAKKDELSKLPAPEQPKKPDPVKPGDKPAAPAPAPRAPEAPREPAAKPAAPAPNTGAMRTRLNNEIRSLENRERTLAAEVGRFTPQGAIAGAANDAAASFLSQDSVRFWVHDATAAPGEKYRYRVRLGINNPLFGRGMLLKEEQRKLAENSILKSPWSEWSAPVDVDRAEYFFVTSATPDNETSGAARASVELFKFYFGHYRKQTAGMNIGDPLSGEIILGKLAIAPNAPQAPAVPPAPGGAPAGAPGIANAPAAAPEAPVAALPFTAPERIRVTLDGVMLLDISSIPVVTGDKPGFVAVLRDIDGNIILRNPENDRDSALYKRMEASAAAAKAGG